jgi:hypothetical protein
MVGIDRGRQKLEKHYKNGERLCMKPETSTTFGAYVSSKKPT